MHTYATIYVCKLLLFYLNFFFIYLIFGSAKLCNLRVVDCRCCGDIVRKWKIVVVGVEDRKFKVNCFMQICGNLIT